MHWKRRDDYKQLHCFCSFQQTEKNVVNSDKWPWQRGCRRICRANTFRCSFRSHFMQTDDPRFLKAFPHNWTHISLEAVGFWETSRPASMMSLKLTLPIQRASWKTNERWWWIYQRDKTRALFLVSSREVLLSNSFPYDALRPTCLQQMVCVAPVKKTRSQRQLITAWRISTYRVRTTLRLRIASIVFCYFYFVFSVLEF